MEQILIRLLVLLEQPELCLHCLFRHICIIEIRLILLAKSSPWIQLLSVHKICLARMEASKLCNVSSQGNIQIKLTYCDETKRKALNSHTVRDKETPS